MNLALFRLANQLYRHCYPVYRPLYAGWKAMADRRERAVLRRLLRPGMTVLDVGANIGVYSRFFAHRVGPGGHVHAFEPAPANFARLREYTAGLPQVHPHHAAVGERSGRIRLFESEELNVDHRTFDSGDGRSSTEVPLVALDEHLPPGTRVDLIKVDVQGYELAVLRGARRLLQDNPGVRILMEYWPYGLRLAGVQPADLLDTIRSSGLQVLGLDGGTPDLAHLEAAREDHYCNLLLGRDH